MSDAVDAKDIEAAVFAKAGLEREEAPPIEDEIKDEVKEPVKPVVAEKSDAEKLEAEDNARIQKKIQYKLDAITREKNEALREAKHYRQLAEAKREEVKSVEPKEEDFPTWDAFQRATINYSVNLAVEAGIKQSLGEREAMAHRRAEQAEHDANISAWNEKEAAYSSATPDYKDVMKSAENIDIPQHMVLAMMESDLGPQIAYYLAKNPGECETISALSPLSAARAIGRIERQLESEPVKTVLRSEAPAPLKPIRGGTAGGATKSPEDMTQKEYNEWRDRAQKKRLSG